MNKSIFKKFEMFVHYFLTIILVVYITIELVELAYQFGKAIFFTRGDGTRLLISKAQTAEVMPVFFNILIALGIINTFNIYITEQVIKLQSILMLGLVSMCRKLFMLDVANSNGLNNIGLATIIIALALGYYLVRRLEMKRD